VTRQLGLVASLNKPGGNVTGVTLFCGAGVKRLRFSGQLVPTAPAIAILINPNYAPA
jgi:putative ABC transport system substrate-binding protein